jgi:hypothetical protein
MHEFLGSISSTEKQNSKKKNRNKNSQILRGKQYGRRDWRSVLR